MHIDGRQHGDPPYTLLDYFPDDFLCVLDESHVAVPQLHGQYAGDRSRKETLLNMDFVFHQLQITALFNLMKLWSA